MLTLKVIPETRRAH